MKKMYKGMLLVLCAVLLVAASVMGTLAYLKSETNPVTNTFTVGQVGITLNEAKTDEYGVTLTGNEAERVTGNEYKLVPGRTYEKAPTITVNTGSEDCWVFARLNNGLSTNATFDINGDDWTEITAGVYAYKQVLSASDSVVLFTKFTFNENADPADYENAEIAIIGYAVQAYGFTSAEDAWNATFGAPTNP